MKLSKLVAAPKQEELNNSNRLAKIERLTIKIELARKTGNIGLEECLLNQLKALKGK